MITFDTTKKFIEFDTDATIKCGKSDTVLLTIIYE